MKCFQFLGGREMQNLLEELKKLLEQDERLVVEGKLLKNKIIESVLKLDIDLIRLLLRSETIKTHFFQEVDGVLVFDKIKFQKFVSNKAFLSDSYTSFKNKIGLVTENEEYLSESKEAVLAWPYKDCVLEGGMEKENEKRDEIFYNEILAPDEIDRLLEPKVLTNFKRIDKDGEYKVRELKENDNLIIKGNNLLALHSLKKRFAGKVKLIYIDPPYNTGNDSFNYNDSFNHSTWLTFMKNRLEVAREVLREDGVIFISCDDNEQAYLKVLCDGIFKRENYVGLISVAKGTTTGQDAKLLGSSVDYLIIYGKDVSNFEMSGLALTPKDLKRFSNEDEKGRYSLLQLRKTGSGDRREDRPNLYYSIKAPDGSDIYPVGPTGYKSRWRVYKKTYESWVKQSLIKWIKKDNRYVPYVKYYAEGRTKQVSNLWNDIEGNKKATIQLKELFGERIFNNPKPIGLIKKIIHVSGVENDDIVLDFFSGSGTTTQAVLELNKEDGSNRQFILCEQLDYIDTVTIPRVKKVIQKIGEGDFVYLELMKLNEAYTDKIEKVKTAKELLDIWKTMKEKAFLSYKVDVKQFDENVNEFEELDLENQKKFLIECLDKNQLYINLSEIDDTEYEISKEDKELNKQFYGVK
jgi:adenine-specific DNA-methyltransferase